MKRHRKWTVGIDEVGRGALAGPVVVAAALLRHGKPVVSMEKETGMKLRDSKRLSPRHRVAWMVYFAKNPAAEFAVARVYPRRIEKMNISRAANLAALRAYNRLMSRCAIYSRTIKDQSCYDIFLDGGLFLGNRSQPKNAQTVIKGDEKIPAVAIASIIAKVYRDRMMRRLAKKYPQYAFDVHKGYGTKKHYEAIEKNGLCVAHRKTFRLSSRPNDVRQKKFD